MVYASIYDILFLHGHTTTTLAPSLLRLLLLPSCLLSATYLYMAWTLPALSLMSATSCLASWTFCCTSMSLASRCTASSTALLTAFSISSCYILYRCCRITVSVWFCYSSRVSFTKLQDGVTGEVAQRGQLALTRTVLLVGDGQQLAVAEAAAVAGYQQLGEAG